MVSARKAVEVPEIRTIPFERGVVLYTCNSCEFRTEDPEAAAAHGLEENKGRRRDSNWRHQIQVSARRDSPVQPCPLCICDATDLKSHLLRQHGKQLDRLLDVLIQLQTENARLTGIARTLVAQTRRLWKDGAWVRKKKLTASHVIDMGSDDESLEDDPC
jgi:hypothetical protein